MTAHAVDEPRSRDLVSQLLSMPGADAPDVATSKLDTIRRLLLLTLACESWAALSVLPYSEQPARWGGVAVAFSALAIAGWRPERARPALAGAAVLLAGVVVAAFPENANHQFLALVMAALVLLARDDEPHEVAAALGALRWLALIGFFWAGVMKLWYGHWLGGEFLTWRIAQDARFDAVLGPLIPAAQRELLLGLGHEVGAGPFRVDAPALVLVSNLTWLAELVLPVGLVLRRTRALALPAALALLIAIEIGAREIFFGGLMAGLLLLFARGDAVRRALPWTAAVYLLWLLRREIAALAGLGAAA